jgi:predicted phosphodiesterase
MSEITKRFEDETFDDYFVRLFEHKDEYGLDCQAIADILNDESGEQYGESKWRKDFRLFNRGRIYERKKMSDGVALRILALSDFHYPYQLPIETFSDYVGTIDVLVLNGDIVDMKDISRFQRTYRNSPMDEIIGCRTYLISLIEYLRPEKVIITHGNHEIRFGNYLAKNLDSDLTELMPQTPLELIFEDGFNHYDKVNRAKVWYEPLNRIFDTIEIEYVNNWYVKIGKTIFAHPLTYSSGMLKTTEKAVNFFYRTEEKFDCISLAHTHKLGSFIQSGVYMFEQGACCHTETMTYNDGKLVYPQQKGFIYLCQDKDGNLLYDKTKTISL